MWSIVPWRKPLLIFRHISSSRNSIYSTIVKEAGRKIIFGSAEEEGKRRGEEVEKSEVYENIFPTTNLTKEMRRGGWENIFPKTNLTKEMRRGVRWAGPGGLLFPRLPSHSPLFKRSVSWLTCTRTGLFSILKKGFDCSFASALRLSSQKWSNNHFHTCNRSMSNQTANKVTCLAKLCSLFTDFKQDHQWWRYHRRLFVDQSPYF